MQNIINNVKSGGLKVLLLAQFEAENQISCSGGRISDTSAQGIQVPGAVCRVLT